MKILQINVVYKTGSTGKIVYDIHSRLLEKQYESIICYGRGKKTAEAKVHKSGLEIPAKFNALKARFTGMQYAGSLLQTRRLLQIIKKENPDVVHLHCLNGFFVNIYYLIEFLKTNKIKTILTLHAEFMYTGSCAYAFDCEKWLTGCGGCPQLKYATYSKFLDLTHYAWKKMKNAFENFETLKIVSVSPWLQQRAELSPIFSGKKHYTILNGIDIDIFRPQNYDHLKRQYHLTNEKIILHVTANFCSEIKGGKYIIALAKRLEQENIKIIVIGNKDKSLNLPSNMIDVGQTENQIQLAAFYSMADLTVIASKKETFSMICAESLCCGTPVVGFQAGAPEQISLMEYSEFVPYDDFEALENCVNRWIDKKSKGMPDIISKAHETYSKNRMAEDYIALYASL